MMTDTPSEKDNNSDREGANDLITETKTARNFSADRDVEIENGHLAELEVDITGILSKANEEEGDWDADTSPFPAVRAVVPEYDDPAIPVNTLRAWFLGIVCNLRLWGE